MIQNRVGSLLEAMEAGVWERREATRLAFLATAAGESVFFLGPPGVAKSLIARRLKHAFRGATSFEYLMGRFSTPDEIFGPISIRRLKEQDRYERITDNYLPDADIVFLDEIWKAGPPIQNALLTALNEKRFRNGAQELRIPMKGLISASNHIPETDAGQRAFWDRFLVRLPLRAIEDDVAFHSMLTDATDEYEDTVGDELKVGEEEYGRWQAEIARVALPTPVLEVMSRIRRRLNEGAASPEGSDAIYVSDRRWKKVAGLLRASAYLNGRAEVNAMDLGLLRHCLWDRPEEIDSVAGLVAEELRRFDFGEDVKPRSVGRRLGDLKRRIREGTVESYDTESFEPVLYRGEYVRLEGLEEPKIALMWHGDWEALETERGTPCEVFLFDEEVSYAETRAFDDVRRCSEPAIRIDGRRYPVEHRRVSGRATRPRTPEARELHEWLEEARTLAAQAEEAAERALTRHEEGVGQTHLFVEDEFATSAYAALEHAASQLEQFRLIARGIENRLGRLS